MRKEFEGTKEKPTPVKNEEIRHTTSQTGSHVPVSLTDVTEELGEDVEAQQQGRQDRDPAELKLLQFPKPLSGRRPDTNTNTTSTTKTSSSTLPQAKREMQEEKKRMQVNQDMAGFCILV